MMKIRSPCWLAMKYSEASRCSLSIRAVLADRVLAICWTSPSIRSVTSSAHRVPTMENRKPAIRAMTLAWGLMKERVAEPPLGGATGLVAAEAHLRPTGRWAQQASPSRGGGTSTGTNLDSVAAWEDVSSSEGPAGGS